MKLYFAHGPDSSVQQNVHAILRSYVA